VTIKLTFNKPAFRHFIEEGQEIAGGGGAKALRIKIENGIAMFQIANKPGDDTVSIAPRTRGGYEATITGSNTEALLQAMENADGPFFTIKRIDKDWVGAYAHPDADAPPKFQPHVRLWSHERPATKAKTTKRASAAVRSRRAAAPPSTLPTDMPFADRVLWAYRKLNGAKKPGRPGGDILEARKIVERFETGAASKIKTGDIDLPALVEAHQIVGKLIEAAASGKKTKIGDVAKAASTMRDQMGIVGRVPSRSRTRRGEGERAMHA
jgi:hypothetical protein